MKKALILGLSLSLALSLTACGGSNNNAADNNQDTSIPEVSQSVETAAPDVEQATQTTQETTPETTPETEQPSQEENPVPEETGPKFTEVNETVYATTSVNVRASYSADSDKVGSLSSGASVTRTGVGDNGWSRIIYNGNEAYVSSDYLTTTKPTSGSTQTSKPSTNTSKPSTNTGSTQTSKPSTGSSSSSGSTSSGGTQSGSTMTPEEYQEWMKQWGGGTVSADERVDVGDSGYTDWITGQLNGG